MTLKKYILYDLHGKYTHYIKNYDPHFGHGEIVIKAKSLKQAYFYAYNKVYATKERGEGGIVKKTKINYDGSKEIIYR